MAENEFGFPISLSCCLCSDQQAHAKKKGGRGALGAQAPALFQNYSNSAPLRQIAMIL